MIRYQAADSKAAEELVGALSGILLQFLAGPRATRTFSEDLLQECWLQIHKSRHSYRPESSLLPWIFAIARHVRRDAYRRLCREQNHDTQQPQNLPMAFCSCDEDRALSVLLPRLPGTQRQVIEKLKLEGKSLKEVALETSSTIGAVKQRAHRAYRNLRDLVQTGILDQP